jgi:uncharacterized repeat protein (TIGR01451 family)
MVKENTVLTAKKVGHTLALCAATLMGLAACNNTPKSENWDLYNGTVDPFYKRTDAPKPAAKPEPAKPAPARTEPAPAPTSGNVLYIPTGERTGSGLMIEKRVPTEVTVGQEFEYQIIATNLTNTALENVIVTDTVGEGFRIVSSDPAHDMNGSTARWALGSLAGKASKTIRVRAIAGAAGTITSCAGGSYTLALCSTINVVQPALRLTKQAPAEVSLCDVIPVKLVVTNSGTGAARNVKVRDALPAGLTTSDGKTSVELDAGTLAAGQSKEFNLQLKATKTGSYVNKGTAAADGNLNAESNSTTTLVRQPKLTIKAECGGVIIVGRNTTCKFTVTNTGDAACNTTVTAPVSANTAFVSADNGGTMANGNVTWNIGALAPNASKTVTMTVRSTGIGDITCRATANCPCADPVTDSCTSGVRGVADLGTTVTDDDGVVMIGDNHTYSVEVKNQGQIPLTNTKMIVTLPEGMEFVSSANGRAVGRTVEFNFGTVAPGATVAAKFIVKSSRAGEALVVGETTCNEIKTPVRDDELTTFIERP